MLAGRPIRIDGQQLDAHIQLGLRVARLTGSITFRGRAVEVERVATRADARVVAGQRIELANVEQLRVDGGEGEIGARLYTPDGSQSPAPLIVYFHGGGHVIADLDTHDQPCRFLARESGALLLSVDYRLAPEHRFPAAVDDALAAFRWAHREAERLGVDSARIAVAGDSAGGNLATAVALRARLEGGPAPAFQALIYPVTDYSAKYRSAELFGDGFYLTRRQMDWFSGHYFASAQQRLDPSASPLLAPDLGGVAPSTCRHRRLRSPARRGRGLCQAPRGGGRSDDAAPRTRPRSRLHQRRRARRATGRGAGCDCGRSAVGALTRGRSGVSSIRPRRNYTVKRVTVTGGRSREFGPKQGCEGPAWLVR